MNSKKIQEYGYKLLLTSSFIFIASLYSPSSFGENFYYDAGRFCFFISFPFFYYQFGINFQSVFKKIVFIYLFFSLHYMHNSNHPFFLLVFGEAKEISDDVEYRSWSHNLYYQFLDEKTKEKYEDKNRSYYKEQIKKYQKMIDRYQNYLNEGETPITIQ